MDPTNSHNTCKKLLSYIMSTAGDCRLMISHVTSTDEIEKFREQYQIMDDTDHEIQNIIDEIGIDENSSGSLSVVLFSLIFINMKLHS